MLDAFKTNGSSPPDFNLSDHGTLYLLRRPVTPAAHAWVEQRLPEDATWFAGTIVVEHHYTADIVVGTCEAGLALRAFAAWLLTRLIGHGAMQCTDGTRRGVMGSIHRPRHKATDQVTKEARMRLTVLSSLLASALALTACASSDWRMVRVVNDKAAVEGCEYLGLVSDDEIHDLQRKTANRDANVAVLRPDLKAKGGFFGSQDYMVAEAYRCGSAR